MASPGSTNPLVKFLLPAALGLLAGCSAIDLAYDYAPALVAGEIEDAFDLDRTQLERVDERLQRFFAWHREEELARYQDLLDRAARDVADGISADEFLAFNAEIREAWRRSLEKAIDDLGDLAPGLKPQQIEKYDRYFREGSERYDDYDRQSQQQREIARVDGYLDRLEHWFGDLDYYQRKKARARLAQIPDVTPQWIEYREARHRAFLAALREAADADATRRRLKAILVDPSAAHEVEFQASRVAFWQGYALALQDISDWLSDRQKRRAAERLRDYAEIAARLVGEG